MLAARPGARTRPGHAASPAAARRSATPQRAPPTVAVARSGPCVVTTDGERYLFADGTAHAADDPASVAGHVVASTAGSNADPGQPTDVAGADEPVRVIGPGEQALRQLIDDGII